MSPGPYGDSRRTPSRTTPNSQVFRPVPQHLSSPGPRGTYSPITAAMSRPSYAPSPAYGHAGQGHGQSPGPMSPMGKYGSPARTFEWGFPNFPGPNGQPQGMQQIPGMPSSVAPATADVIALQSQITHLQDEQERIQRKTFVNWINSYLSKRKPQMKVENLIDDLKDGVKLLALLEVLSGERLPMERGRVLRLPHYLSNCNTALEFLRSKRIKLVNINASDVVDGKPAVVLGLIWTIILYFQIEENTRVLEKLGQRYASPSVDRRGYASSTDDDRSVREGSISRKTQEKWKVGAKKALLQWVQAQVSKQLGVQVNDFGPSWRDGNAFLAVVNSIRPGSEVTTENYSGLVDMESMRHLPNTVRLETAFTVADTELGIAPLLDPEDVDVDRPDKKSIMTYVAQFLHRYPEGSEGRRRSSVPRQIKSPKNGEKKLKKSSSKTDLLKVEVKKTSSKSEIKRRDSLKSNASQSEIKRTSSTKSVPQRRESVTSPTGFLAKVTCWQQRIDPEAEVNVNKKKKQRPVSIAGDADSVSLKGIGNGLKRTPSMGSLSIPENGGQDRFQSIEAH